MLRSVILAFALLSCMVLAAVAAGVHFVSEYIRDHQYTVGELETAVYRFDASTDDGGPIEALATHVEMAAGVLEISPPPSPRRTARMPAWRSPTMWWN